MDHVTTRLKNLREQAEPSLSIRGMAEALGVPPSTYAFYENPKTYKKSYLPIELARSVANILSLRGVQPSSVLALTGLSFPELEPEAMLIEGRREKTQLVVLPVALPSHQDLKEMFLHILIGMKKDMSLEESANHIARLLPMSLVAYSRETTILTSLAHERDQVVDYD